MGPITALIPVARSATLGGHPVLVWEGRLRELAELQAILDDELPDPLEVIRDRLDAAQGEARRLLLVSAYEAAELGPPVYGEPRGAAFYCTPEGLCLFLWAALKRGNPRLTAEDVTRLALDMRPGEYERIWRIFHGTSWARSQRVLANMLLGIEEECHRSNRLWPEIIDEVRRDTGMTYDEIYDLTFTEFRNIRREGKPDMMERRLRPGEDPDQAVAEQRRRFYGQAAQAGS
jgi:hypothetical protein